MKLRRNAIRVDQNELASFSVLLQLVRCAAPGESRLGHLWSSAEFGELASTLAATMHP
jgi:hypothetical protein